MHVLDMASCHTFLLPGRVDIQPFNTADLAVSNTIPAFCMAEARLHSCITHSVKTLLAGRLTYGKTLETNTFQFSSPDYVYMLLFGMGCMSVRRSLSLQLFTACLLMHCLQTAWSP